MNTRLRDRLTPVASLPSDHAAALLVGRVFMPAAGGPVLVRIAGDDLRDVSPIAPTSS